MIENNNILDSKGKIRYFSDIIQGIKAELAGEIGYKKIEGTNHYINNVLFKSNKEITENDILERQKKIKESIIKYKKLKEEVSSALFLNNEQKKFFLGTINEQVLELIMINNRGIYIEAEKGGYKLDKNQKNEYIKKIDKIQTMIYGSKISDSPEEKDIITNYLRELLKLQKDAITENEKNIFENFLIQHGGEKNNKELDNEEKIDGKNERENISQDKFCTILKKSLDIYGIQSIFININKESKDYFYDNGILHIPLDRDKDKLKDFYKKEGIYEKTKIIIDPKASSIEVSHIFDGKEIRKSEIKIPSIQKSFTTKRVCELLDHELTHFITSVNNSKTLNTTGENFLQLQEGVAMINEKAVSNKINKDIIKEPTIHNITTFIGENYGGKECLDLLKIYYKLNGKDEKKAEAMSANRLRRIKRRHSFDEPGANLKDVVYRRGLSDVLQYLEGIDKNKQEDRKKLQKEIKNFYSSKFGKENMKDADHIFDGLEIKEEDIIMPFAVGKIIYEKILGNKVNSIDDIRFIASEHKLNYKQIKILLQIIQLMKEDI